MWKDLEKPWQEAFKLAWEAYKHQTIPIGAVILDDQQQIIARGRNMIFDQTSTNCLAGTWLAHAEMTAMIQLKESEHPKINHYTLYTTLEPCPMCFGAMVMMNIRNLKYAGRDHFAGATILNERMDYIHKKNLSIERGSEELETFQTILHTVSTCERKHRRLDELLNSWGIDSPTGVKLGLTLFDEGYFPTAHQEGIDISILYDEVMTRLDNDQSCAG